MTPRGTQTSPDAASLHGIVDLRITKPELPWPDPDLLVEHALAAVRAASNPRP